MQESRFDEYMIKAKTSPIGEHIGDEKLQVGQRVKLFKIEGDNTDWGCSPKEFENIKVHHNKDAKITAVHDYYVDLEFDDGFKLGAVNDHQVKKA